MRELPDTRLLDLEKDMKLLVEWFDGRAISLERHYRGSENGFNWFGFSSKMTGMRNVLVVVESTTGKKFGGFTSVVIMDDSA